MKVICATKYLREAILTAERFTSRHITLPILSHILLKTDERGISLTATNLEIGVEYLLPGKIQKPGVVTAPAKLLSQLIQSLPDETVTLEAKGQQLTLHSASNDATILGLNPSEFPTLPEIKTEHSFVVPAARISGALRRVVLAAATSATKTELTGIFFSASPHGSVIAGTDTFRLAEYTAQNLEGVADTFECIVPSRAIHELLRTVPDDADLHVAVGERQIVFSWNETRILSRLIDGAYPPYRRIIPGAYETTLVVSRDELLRAVRLASVFASRLNDVTLRFSPTELAIETANTESGGTTSRLEAKGKGAAGSVMFNHRYLSDGVEAAGGEETRLSMNGISGPALIQNPTDAAFLYLLMPIRTV